MDVEEEHDYVVIVSYNKNISIIHLKFYTPASFIFWKNRIIVFFLFYRISNPFLPD